MRLTTIMTITFFAGIIPPSVLAAPTEDSVIGTSITIIAPLILLFCITYLIYVLINPPKKNPILKIRRQIRDILDIPLKDIMTDKPITLPENTTADNIISIFTANNAGSILVTDGKKIKGIITETDILSKVQEKKLATLTAGDIMTKTVTSAEESMCLGEAELLMIKHRIRRLPIIENDNLTGIVTMTDILKTYQDFFNKHAFESGHIPLVNAHLSKDYIRAQANDGIKDHLKQFIKWKSNAILAMQKTKLLGIITERDILTAYKQNPRSLATATAKSLMKTTLITIPKDTSIIKANSIMIEKDISRLPVMEGDEVAGFITQTEVLEAFCTFFAFITSDEGKKAVSNS